MLSAPKESLASKRETDSPESNSVKRSGDLLASIQDFRQIVQGVNLDEVGRANENAQRLMEHIYSLQRVLARLMCAKQLIHGVEETLLKSQQNNSARLPLQRLSLTEAIAGAPNNLIPFPHYPHLAKEEASVSKGVLASKPFSIMQNAQDLDNQCPGAVWSFGDGDTGNEEGRQDNFRLGDKHSVQDNFEGTFTLADIGGEATGAALSAVRVFSRNNGEASNIPQASEMTTTTVPQAFFDVLIIRLTESLGPMASVVVEDQAKNMGESLAAFPRSRLEELITLISYALRDAKLKPLFLQQISADVRTFTRSELTLIAKEG
jgi:hypothetical protein